MPDAPPSIPAMDIPTPDAGGPPPAHGRAPGPGGRFLSLYLATGGLALVNWFVLGSSPLALTAVVPNSPHAAGYFLFLAVLAPLFLVLGSLWNQLACRFGALPLPRATLIAEWAGLAVLPFLGFSAFAARTARGLLILQGICVLLMLLLRLVGMLVHARRRLLDGTGGLRLLITAGLPFIIYLGLFCWLGSTSSTTGDEPYYLMVAKSIAQDRDVSLNNQFVPRAYGSFYWRRRLAPQNMMRTPSGWKSSAYTTLFPLILAPGSLVEPRWGPTILVILLSSLLAAQIFLLTRDLTEDDRAAFFAWGVASFSLPLLAFSSQVYPETAAALLACILLRTALAGKRADGWRTIALGLFLPAILLPALKARYLSISLAGLAVWALRTRKTRRVALLAVAVAMALAALVALDYLFLEKTMLLARFPALDLIFRLKKLIRFGPIATAGLLADQEFGLLPYSPLYFLVPAGIWWSVRKGASRHLLLLLPVVVYLTVLIGHFGHLWYGGFSQPSRYLVAVLPLTAPFLGWAWKEGRGAWFRAFVALALVWSALVAFPFFLQPAFRFQQADGINNILGLLGARRGMLLGRILPSFLNLEGWCLRSLAVLALVLLAPSLLFILTRKSREGWARTTAAALVMAVAAGLLVRGAIHRPTRSLEAESLPQRGGKISTSLQGGPVVIFDGPGWVEGEIYTRRENLLLAMAVGVRGDQNRPVMAVTLDGRAVGRMELSGTVKHYLRRDYRVVLSAPPGKHTLRFYLHFPGRPPRSSAYLDRFTLTPLG